MNRLISTGTVAALWLSATTPSYALFGGPFDRGHAFNLSSGTYEAIYQLPNGNGIVRFSESNNGHLSQYNLSSVFYRGIVYYGNAIGTVNLESGYATGMSNSRSYGDSENPENNNFYSGISGNIGICNATWQADIVSNGYSVRFEGDGVAHFFGQLDQTVSFDSTIFNDASDSASGTTSGGQTTVTDNNTTTTTSGNQSTNTTNNNTTNGFNNQTGFVDNPLQTQASTTVVDTTNLNTPVGIVFPQLADTSVSVIEDEDGNFFNLNNSDLYQIQSFTASYPVGTDVFSGVLINPVDGSLPTGELQFTDPVTGVVTSVFPLTITVITQVVDDQGNEVGDPINSTSTNGDVLTIGAQDVNTVTTTVTPVDPGPVTTVNNLNTSVNQNVNQDSNTVSNGFQNAVTTGTDTSNTTGTTGSTNEATSESQQISSVTTSLGGEDPVFEDVGHRVPFRVFGSRVSFTTAATTGETYTPTPPIVDDYDAPIAIENTFIDFTPDDPDNN